MSRIFFNRLSDSAAGSFFGARGLQSILGTLSDVKFTVIDDLKLETLLKFDCLVFPDCKKFGERFYGIYSDHFTFKGAAPGNVWVVDNEGSPAWIGGTVGKGRVVLNGGITFHLTNREVSAGEFSVEEKQLIADAVRFCAGKNGHVITPEGLTSLLEVLTDAVRQVIRFKVKAEPAFPLKNARLICRIRRDGKDIARREIKLPETVAGSWESDHLLRFDIIPGKKAAVLYITLTAAGKEAVRSYKVPAPKN